MSARQERRARLRQLAKELRRQGCKCDPTLYPNALPPLEPGGSRGGWVKHELSCPLGQRLNEQNRRGEFPVILVGPSCERPR